MGHAELIIEQCGLKDGKLVSTQGVGVAVTCAVEADEGDKDHEEALPAEEATRFRGIAAPVQLLAAGPARNV